MVQRTHLNRKSKSIAQRRTDDPIVANLSGNTHDHADHILHMQQTLGNQAVQRMMETESESDSAPARDSHGNGCKCLACSGIQRYAETKALQRETEQHGKGCSCASCSGESLQRKAETDTPTRTQDADADTMNGTGYDNELLQRQLGGDIGLDDFLSELDNKSKRTIKDHRPSTGLGRFDVEYLPRTGKLKITVKAFLDFGDKDPNGSDFVSGIGNWTTTEKQTFAQNFKTQAEAAWSGKFKFKPKKSGFSELPSVTPEVTFVSVDSVDKSHFHHRVAKNKVMGTGIGREQNDINSGSRVNIGNFMQSDENVGPQGASICGGIASHDMIRITNILKGTDVNPIRFKSNGSSELDNTSKQKVKAFARRLEETARPGSVPVPLILVGVDNKRERQFSKNDNAALRVATAKNYLEPLLGNVNNPIVTKTSDVTADDVTKAKTRYDKTKKQKGDDHSFTKEDKAKYEDLSSKVDHRQVIVEFDKTFKWTGDPYSVLAHEFGHMLGNPDEYFEYGSEKIRDAKVKQLSESGNKDDLIRATQIQSMSATNDTGKSDPQEAFGKLAKDTGQTIPEFGPKTSSIMSAGADVLPVHYAPLLEALSTITADTLPLTEWTIE